MSLHDHGMHVEHGLSFAAQLSLPKETSVPWPMAYETWYAHYLEIVIIIQETKGAPICIRILLSLIIIILLHDTFAQLNCKLFSTKIDIGCRII